MSGQRPNNHYLPSPGGGSSQIPNSLPTSNISRSAIPTAGSSLTIGCHLAGVVHNDRSGEINQPGKAGKTSTSLSSSSSSSSTHSGRKILFRRYAGLICTALRRNDVQELSNKTVFYEIGTRSGECETIYRRLDDPSLKFGIASQFNTVLTVGLKGVASRISHFTGEWTHFDFTGMICLLAASVAKFNNTQTLTCAEMRRGYTCDVRSLNVVVEPVQANPTCVFIPRCTDSLVTTAVFSALAAAANGTGSHVVTDYVTVDGNNCPVYTEAQGINLASACISALRMLMSIYSVCDDGELAAVALTAGIHRVVSVVSHSDEGGIVRDILRTMDFRPSYGGVYNPAFGAYMGLPVPHERNTASICTWVDNIALLTAGAVAVAAPVVTIDGRSYPQWFTSTEHGARGTDAYLDADAGDEANIRTQIAINHHEFTSNYATVLARIFMVNDSKSRGGLMLGTMCETLCTSSAERKHFRHVTVAPWFWIEPTSLFKDRMDSAATRAGFGPICGVRDPHHMNTFESVQVGHTTALTTCLIVGMRCPRTSGYMLHLSCRATDGLANIIPLQLDPNNICGKGGGAGAEGSLTARESMAEWVWKRGQSPIYHPAEMNYIGKAMLLKCAKLTYDDDEGSYTPTSLHLTEEMVGGVVSVMACSPERIADDAVHAWTRQRRHQRTLAHISLGNATRRMRGYFDSCPMMPSVSFTEPMLRAPENTVLINVDNTLQRADENMTGVLLPIPHAGSTIPHVIVNTPLRPVNQRITSNAISQHITGTRNELGVAMEVNNMIIDNISHNLSSTTEPSGLDWSNIGHPDGSYPGSEATGTPLNFTRTSSASFTPSRGDGPTGGGGGGPTNNRNFSSGIHDGTVRQGTTARADGMTTEQGLGFAPSETDSFGMAGLQTSATGGAPVPFPP